jgi:hypothetical protein
MIFRKPFRLLLSFLALTFLWGSALAAPPNGSPPGLDVAKAALERNGAGLLAIPGAVGYGITQGNNGQAVITVFTGRPLIRGVPVTLDGVPVNALFTGQFYALAPPVCGGPPSQRPDHCFDTEPTIDPTARFDRPVPIGVSTGHPAITAGTIGARVVDSSGNIYALSNNHVFSNSNDAFLGDDIYQPGPYDGGSVSDVYASLFDFEIIDFNGANNTMDAAIAGTDSSLLGNGTPSDGYGTPASTTTTAALGVSVQKYGRTTGFTQGNVEAIDVTVNVCYEGSSQCTKLATFVDQIIISDGQFSAGGDSGSLIVTTDGNLPVALLFAGSSSYTIASPIDVVLNRFNVTIDGEDVTPPPPAGDFSLSTDSYKVKGLQKADLTWSGTAVINVDVYRDGSLIATAANDGFYTDDINNKGGGSYLYKICESGSTTNCSNESVVNF